MDPLLNIPQGAHSIPLPSLLISPRNLLLMLSWKYTLPRDLQDLRFHKYWFPREGRGSSHHTGSPEAGDGNRCQGPHTGSENLERKLLGWRHLVARQERQQLDTEQL